MKQNKKLLSNIEAYEQKESAINKFARKMYDVAGNENQETVRQIINALKPKQNGERK